MQVRRQVKISAVLVPTHKGGTVRLFQEQGAVVNQNIGPDQVLYRVQNAWVVRQLISPIEQQVRLGFFGEVNRRAPGRFPGFKLGPRGLRFSSGQHRHRADKAVALIVSHLRRAQPLAHGWPATCCCAAVIMASSMSSRGCMGLG